MKYIINIVLIGFISICLQSEEINQNVKNFSQLPDIYDIKISPNGKLLGVLREIDQERMVSIIELETSKLIHNHRFIKKGQIGNFEWLSDERLLFARRIKFAGENRLFTSGELYATNIDGKKSIMLTGRQAKRSSDTVKDDPKQRAMMVDNLEDDPDNILIRFYTSDGYHKLYKVNTFRGDLELFAAPPVRNPSYLFDKDANLLGVSGMNPDTFKFDLYIYNKNLPLNYFGGSSCSNLNETECIEVIGSSNKKKIYNKNWSFWKTVTWDDPLRMVAYDDGIMYTIENNGNDLSGLYKTNLQSGKKSLIYRHDIVDIDGAMVDDEGIVYGAMLMDGYLNKVFFKGESKEKELAKLLNKKFPNSYISVTAKTDDESKMTLFVSSDINPGIYYLYNKETDQVRPLGRYWGSIDYANLAYMEPISFPAKDGTIIHGYLTRSKKGNSNESPTIVNPHGGPDGVRDRWGFDPFVQMLASEGFNVLQINFRGSGGYGMNFLRYIRAKWDVVLNDVFDGIEYLSNEEVIDINRICIYGGSYGGYAATQGAIMRPDLFKCSASDVGVYHLPNLKKNGDIQASRGGQAQLDIRLGTDEERLKEMSPHFNATKLTVPFFMIHGKNDIRAPYEDAIKFSKKLKELGIEHKTHFVEKEGHGYFNEDVRYDNNMRILDFFNQYLN